MIDRRIQKSQAAIKDAFIQLMSKKDFDTITIQDITDVANVGRRTFYHHYMDKYDLLSKLIEEHIDKLKNICDSAINCNTDNSELLWFDYFEENYDFFATMLAGKGQFAFRKLFLKFVIDEIKEMTVLSQGINKELDEDIYLKFFSSAIVGVIEDYFTKNQPKTSKKLADQVMILLNRNL